MGKWELGRGGWWVGQKNGKCFFKNQKSGAANTVVAEEERKKPWGHGKKTFHWGFVVYTGDLRKGK